MNGARACGENHGLDSLTARHSRGKSLTLIPTRVYRPQTALAVWMRRWPGLAVETALEGRRPAVRRREGSPPSFRMSAILLGPALIALLAGGSGAKPPQPRWGHQDSRRINDKG